ncbi:MAG: hypothetical protein ACI4AA_03545 [Lachnospiraceae bacterium]
MTIDVCLAAYGTLRRSEICALTSNDIDYKNNVIHIHSALVMNDKKEFVEKTTKTLSSDRCIDMHAIGVPDVYIMERGGWHSDIVLKKIYRGSMEDYKKKFVEMTNNHFETMQHEMQHKK